MKRLLTLLLCNVIIGSVGCKTIPVQVTVRYKKIEIGIASGQNLQYNKSNAKDWE